MSGQRDPFQRRSRRPHGDAHAWAVSYVDMLTLLLCFFIIFFSMKKEQTHTPFLDQIVKAFDGKKQLAGQAAPAKGTDTGTSTSISAKVDLKGSENGQSDGSRKGEGAGMGEGVAARAAMNGSGSGAGTGSGNGKGRGMGGADLSKASGTIRTIAQNDFVKDYGKVGLAKDQLVIEIPQVSFFPSSKKKLTPEGIEVTKKMIESLKPFIGRIHVTIQGHTDPRPFKGSTIEDNWELSVLRASTVLRAFIVEGFPQEDISAEGFADQRAYSRTIATDKETEELAHLRRITLKIREKGYE